MAVEKHEMPSQSPEDAEKAERLRRFVGDTYEQDKADIEYWRNASMEEHGRALRELMDFAESVVESTGTIKTEEKPRFPIPWHERHTNDVA